MIELNTRTASLSLSLGFLYVFYRVVRKYTNPSLISKIPGPPSPSFVYGNMVQLLSGQAGEADIKWQEEYGKVVSIKGQFGQEVLLVTDPKVVHHVYQVSGYKYPKPPERRVLQYVVNGPGIANVEGEDHKRQRKVMLNGFGAPAMRAFTPIFNIYASKLAAVWRDQVNTAPGQIVTVDILFWASRAMLDALGETAFDYNFGMLENMENALAKAFMRVMLIFMGTVGKAVILFIAFAQAMPKKLLAMYLRNSNVERLSFARYTAGLATDLAKELVDQKSKEIAQGNESKDILSLLIKANANEDEKSRLTDEELWAQLRTIMVAGHETSSSTLAWALLELAKAPEVQVKLRHEIREMQRTKTDPEFTWQDFEQMPYLQAVVKETLRYHPVAYNSYRIATVDEVIPLAFPITLKNGQVITELPVKKGQRFITSVSAYNRIKELFGDDADKFNPDRWLHRDEFKSTVDHPNVGVYNNMFTFSAGVHTCTGWRFAVIELQCFIVEMISTFEFLMTEDSWKVRREACGVMSPTIEGKVDQGFQLPLRLKLAPRN